jgi:hypothetical protein
MEARCTNCGCCLLYRAETEAQYRATLSRWYGYADESTLRKSTNPPDSWQVGWVCLGCKRTSYLGRIDEFYSQEEAEEVVRRQNAFADTPEARLEGQQWDEEEERCAQRDAQRFAELLHARFPQWGSRMKFLSPSEHHGIYFVVSPRPEDPTLQIAMEAQLKRREVLLLCNAWHEHFEPYRGSDHLLDALGTIEQIVKEEYQFAYYYKEGKCYWGERQPPGYRQTWDGYADKADTILVSSWRGTYQQTLHQPIREPLH